MEEVIKGVYETQFATAYETYKEAVTKDSSIRLQDVKGYLNKRDDIQVKSKPRGSNSFVSSGANYEFEIDIMDILARHGGEGVRYGLVAIDIFYQGCRSNPYQKQTTDRINTCIKINISVNGET